MNTLAELDHATEQHHPATWSPALVLARLVEAYRIERRLPEPQRSRPRQVVTAWPTTSREFSDVVGYATEAREAVWSDWQRAKGAHPFEVTQMWEALDWLAILQDHPGDARCLVAWAKCKAMRGSIARMIRRWPGQSKTTLYNGRNAAAVRIALHLNSHGVAVR